MSTNALAVTPSFGSTAVTAFQVHWDHHAIAFSPSSHWGAGAPTRAYVGTDGGMATSTNGTSWTNINEGIATNLFRSIDIGRGSQANNAYTFGAAQDTGTAQHRPTYAGTDWHLGIDETSRAFRRRRPRKPAPRIHDRQRERLRVERRRRDLEIHQHACVPLRVGSDQHLDSCMQAPPPTPDSVLA